MSPDGIMWLVIDVLGVVLLGAALVYGTMHVRRRSKAAMERAGKQPDD